MNTTTSTNNDNRTNTPKNSKNSDNATNDKVINSNKIDNRVTTQSPNKTNFPGVSESSKHHEISDFLKNEQILNSEKDNRKNNAVPNNSDINTSTNNLNVKNEINLLNKDGTKNQNELGNDFKEAKKANDKKQNLTKSNENKEAKVKADCQGNRTKEKVANQDNDGDVAQKEVKKRGGKGGRRKKDDDEESDESFKINPSDQRIFQQLKDNKGIKHPSNLDQVQKERPKPVIDNTIIVEHIINLEELNKKEKISNTEMIFAILEITKNTKYYGMTNSTKSRIFWEILENFEEYGNVFGSFKSETLRKYWRTLSSVENNEKMINVIKEHQELIDNPVLK